MTGTAVTVHKRTPVIIDTDPGVDDIVAILLALASPELEILAFIISFGNTDIDSSNLNVLKVYQAISRHLEHHPNDKDRFPNLFVKPIFSRGCEGPLEGDLHSAQYFHGRDGLGGITERHPELNVMWSEGSTDHPHLRPTQKSGVDVALELIRSNPARSITYVVLGPLTNLAWMMRLDGDLVRCKIGRIVCMGGALDVPGNTSPVAEFNFFADPYAVKELLMPSEPHTGLPLDRFILLPLDITTPHDLPFPFYREKVDPAFNSTTAPSIGTSKPPLTHFTSSFLERTREVMLEFGKDAMELHDIVAVWCAIENPPLVQDADADTLALGWKARRRTFKIERTGEITRGMLVTDRREDENAYALGANRAEVQAEFDKHNFKHRNCQPTAVPVQVGIELDTEVKRTGPGVLCVTDTPGPSTLLDLLLKRVWGVCP